MVDLLEDLRMERDYKFNIKQIPKWKNNSERTLAKYYGQIRELNHKLKFTRRFIPRLKP
jgi:hypothetical protein